MLQNRGIRCSSCVRNFAKHSAEIGMPQMYGLMSLMTCFHDQWSRRKWTSYYAAINASEVLRVFVQQTLETAYQTSNCSFNDVLGGAVCCPMGGTMYSEKNINGETQTLGDHDPRDCLSKYDHTRYMRHTLVIRLTPKAKKRGCGVGFAHPNTPAADLFEMARSIEACITTKPADLLKNKALPTALRPKAFQNAPPAQPLYRRGSYRAVMFILFVVALIFFAVSRAHALCELPFLRRQLRRRHLAAKADPQDGELAASDTGRDCASGDRYRHFGCIRHHLPYGGCAGLLDVASQQHHQLLQLKKRFPASGLVDGVGGAFAKLAELRCRGYVFSCERVSKGWPEHVATCGSRLLQRMDGWEQATVATRFLV